MHWVFLLDWDSVIDGIGGISGKDSFSLVCYLSCFCSFFSPQNSIIWPLSANYHLEFSNAIVIDF